jgi:excisionase family DNA binding protein
VSLFNETELRDIIRDEVRTAIRQELGKKPAAAGEFVSVTKAAQIASVSPQTIRVWMKAGKLRGYNAGRVLRVRRQELEDFLAAGPSPASTTDLSPEELADRRFRQRQAVGCERRSSAHGRPPGGTP